MPRLWSPGMKSWAEITSQALPWGGELRRNFLEAAGNTSSLPAHHAGTPRCRGPVPLPVPSRQWPREAKSPPSHPAGSRSGLVPVLNKRKEPLVSSSVSQYFTELCFPYLVQLKSQGEVLYKSKFF